MQKYGCISFSHELAIKKIRKKFYIKVVLKQRAYIDRGGSRQHLVLQMTKPSFLKKINNFYDLKNMKEVSQHGFG